jgi:hypothetical protein
VTENEVVAIQAIIKFKAALQLGVAARAAQNLYFKTRTREALVASKQAEKLFDDAAREALK